MRVHSHRRRSLRRLVAFAPFLILAISLVACGSSSANTGSTSGTGGQTPEATGTTATPAASQHFKVGQVVTIGHTWEVTVAAPTTNTGSQFFAPQKAGDVFLVFSISVKNISTQEQNISSYLQFTLLGAADGQKYTETIDANAGATLDGKVEAGQTLKGAIAYEVPGSVKAFTLGFEADIISPGQTIWAVTV